MFSFILTIFLILNFLNQQIFCQPKTISLESKNITQIAKLNDQTAFNQIEFLFQERAEKWIFGIGAGATVIYEQGELKDKSRFQCKSTSSTGRCDSLIMFNTTKNELGQFARSGSAVDNTKFTFTSYFLSGYEAPINVKCFSSSNQCKFNQTSNVLSVKENDQIILSCESNFWKSDTTYGIPAEMFYRSTNSEECVTNENRFVVVSTDSTTTGKVQNVLLKKDCSRSFTNSESGSLYFCGIRYVNSPDSLRNDEIDRLSIKIDVHYGPLSLVSSAIAHNEFNKTIKQGNSITLKCPYEGNPITYFWKQIGVDSNESAGGREFILPNTLTSGQYQYQCFAYVGGFINSKTESVIFSINIQENRATTKKANLPAIIGGAVGGVVLLILSIILIVYLVKCRQSGSKDGKNVNKTKESFDKAPKSINRKDKPIYKKNNNDESINPLNENNNGTDPANSEFESIRNFNNKKIVKDLNEIEPLTEREAPLPSKRFNKQSSTSSPVVKNYPNINDEAKGARDLLNDSNNDDRSSMGIYSPSVAEARRLDAAAPGANQSRLIKDNVNGSKTNLAIKAGGHKVLPTESDLIIKNQAPGESPPSYDAALKQQPNDSPQQQHQIPTTPKRQPQHYQSQGLNNSNLKINSNIQQQQQQQHFNGSQAKLIPATSNKNLNMINMSNNNLIQAQYQPSNLSNPQLNKVEYSDVININRARNRDPLAAAFNEQQQQQQQQQQTQYSSVITLSKPSIV